jgi:hypothetical protein
MTPTPFFLSLRVSATKSLITLVCQVSGFIIGTVPTIVIAVIVAAGGAPAASAQGVSFTGAGAVDFGSANVCPSGKTAPAPCSQTMTLTYSVTASGTLGAPKALTTGAPNLDYTLANGSTCTGSVTQGKTCKVNVTFAPIAPGSRRGAVQIVDSSGNVLATTYIYGSGVGPLIGFLPGQPRSLGTSTGNASLVPSSIATDASGDVFVVDPNRGTPVIKELVAVDGVIPDNPVIKVLTGSGYFPTGLAVDGAGNVFFTDGGWAYTIKNYRAAVRELPAAGGYSTIKTFGVTFVAPVGIAADGSGNVFVGDGNYPASVSEVFAASGYTTSKKLGGDFAFLSPWALTLDNSGNLFVADRNCCPYTGSIFELPASDGYSTVKAINSPGIGGEDGVPGAYGFAIDPAGNLFTILDSHLLVEFLAVDGVLPPSPAIALEYVPTAFVNAMAIDGRGNLYFASYDPMLVQELPFSAPSLTFADTYVGRVSSDSPQSIQIQNQGNATLDVTSFSISPPNWYEVPGSGTPADCATSFSLLPGTGCNVSITFKPTQPDSLTGTLSVVDNSLNLDGGAQSVQLLGEGLTFTPPHIDSLNTNYGAPYSVIYVNGENFSADKGANLVTFNGIAAPVYYSTSTFILATVPGSAASGNLVVTVDGGASNPIAFTVLPMPRVAGISPTSGPVGTVVTISGTNLLDFENHAKVSFNGKHLSILSQSSTTITVAVPYGAVTGEFHVLVNDTGINTSTFTVTK